MTGVSWPASMSSVISSRASVVSFGGEGLQGLPDEETEDSGFDDVAEGAEPAVAVPVRLDERAVGGEHPADGCRGGGPAKLEDHVVASRTRGDALLGVVDHVIGTEAPHYLDVAGAADAGDLGAEVLGDLDGEGPNPAGGADD